MMLTSSNFFVVKVGVVTKSFSLHFGIAGLEEQWEEFKLTKRIAVERPPIKFLAVDTQCDEIEQFLLPWRNRREISKDLRITFPITFSLCFLP